MPGGRVVPLSQLTGPTELPSRIPRAGGRSTCLDGCAFSGDACGYGDVSLASRGCARGSETAAQQLPTSEGGGGLFRRALEAELQTARQASDDISGPPNTSKY